MHLGAAAERILFVFLVVPAHVGMWRKSPNPATGHLRFKVQASLSINQSIFNHSFKIALLSILQYIYRALKFHYPAAFGARITCRYKKKNPKMYKTTSK